jgi:hypothetical protein|tara:strand:+ start:458 stop:1270 length:813 start_codon:yes stop_codon:yes gene_type:complete
MNEAHTYIDLNDIKLPFKHSDLFTEMDYQVADADYQITHNIQTEHIMWEGSEQSLLPTNARNSRPASVMGYITSKPIQRQLREFYNDTFKVNIVDDAWTVSMGVKFYPITLIKFHKSTVWHREGNAGWYTQDIIDRLKGRVNYAINFPLYGDKDNSRVKFGKPCNNLLAKEKELMQELLLQDDIVEGVTDEDRSLKVSSSIDSVLDETKWNMEVEGVKEGYHCPYIIPLSSYHKVETDGANRISLRFMGNSSKYTYADICKLYDAGELLK